MPNLLGWAGYLGSALCTSC